MHLNCQNNYRTCNINHNITFNRKRNKYIHEYQFMGGITIAYDLLLLPQHTLKDQLIGITEVAKRYHLKAP